MSDTPETDKAKIAFTSLFANDDAYWIPYAIGKKLERERDKYQEQADALLIRLGATQERMIDAERERDKYYNELLTKRGLCNVQEQVIIDWKAEAEKWRAIANDNRN